MDTHATDRSPDRASAQAVATEQVRTAVRAHLRGMEGAPLYLLAAGQPGVTTALLAAVAAELRSAG